jgi:hypothetical protein
MSAFNSMLTKVRDRNWGGTAATVACEPYISGYAFIKWDLPWELTQHIMKFDAVALGHSSENDQVNQETYPDYVGKQLSASCMSVTPPSGTLNKVQFQGLGGSKWSVPGSIDYGDTISIKYTEFSGLPILRIHRAWCNMIRDNKIGLTDLRGTTTPQSTTTGGSFYIKHRYASKLLYWTTKPDGVTVEYYAAYTGVFPLKDPMDAFTGDINSVDKLEIDIDYNVDMVYHEDWVYDACVAAAADVPYGLDGSTLWSRDGFRYQNQKSDEFSNMRSVN